jgi:hypothetical protein
MNIYGTVEADAWSRDFDYENYLSLFKRRYPEPSKWGSAFTEEGYRLFCVAMWHEVKARPIGGSEEEECVRSLLAAAP